MNNSVGRYDFLPTAVPTDALYPSHTYNLNNPTECFNTTVPLADWLNEHGVACMTWATCWEHSIHPNASNASVIEYFKNLIAEPAVNGATAIGMDECSDLAGPKWGHIPGDIPGLKKMTLAAEGFRQGKKLHPELFVAAWNPGFATRSPTGSSPA